MMGWVWVLLVMVGGREVCEVCGWVERWGKIESEEGEVKSFTL